MPLQLSPPEAAESVFSSFDTGNESSIQSPTLDDIRLALIGNVDLKIKVLHDKNFPGWFQARLADARSAINGQSVFTAQGESSPSALALERCTPESLAELSKAVVILRLLLSQTEENLGDVYETSESATMASFLSQCVPVLVDFIDQVHIDQLPLLEQVNFDSRFRDVWNSLSTIICDVFCVILSFANVSSRCLEPRATEVLWRFLSSVVVLHTKSGPARFHLHLVAKAGYKLVPLLLEQGCTGTQSANGAATRLAKDFLASNFAYLDGEFTSLYATLHSDISLQNYADPPISSPGVYTWSRDSTDQYLIDMELLSGSVIATVQILNFLKQEDRAAEPSDAQNKFLNSEKAHICMLHLIYLDESCLFSVGALNLFQYRLAALSSNSETSDDAIYPIFEKLFSRIVELLDLNMTMTMIFPKYLELPSSVLSGLCLKYPGICVHLKNTNVDLKIMNELANLFDASTMLQQMHQLKTGSNEAKKVVDFTFMKRQSPSQSISGKNSSISTDVLANYLLLLSVFTSTSEEFRRRITSFSSKKDNKTGPNFLCLMIFALVENYDFLTSQIIYNYNILRKLQEAPKSPDMNKLIGWLGSNIGVILTLVEHPIYSNTFFLMRSLSRSVSTLRTFFVDCNSVKSSFKTMNSSAISASSQEFSAKSDGLIDILGHRYDRDATFENNGNLVYCLLRILSRIENTSQAMIYFSSFNERRPTKHFQTRKEMCVKKVVILASIANFILDFSSLRYEIVNHDKFLKDLSKMVQKSCEVKDPNVSYDNSDLQSREERFEQLRVQISILQVVKNYLYNENEENRRIVWDFIPLSLIFDVSLYGISADLEPDSELHKLRLQLKVISFEILRNLTAASTYFSEAIKDLYLEFIEQSPIELPIPRTWNGYLFQNLMCFDLFVDFEGTYENNEMNFFQDDEFILRLIKEADFVKLIVAINYLEDHRYTNIPVFHESDFPDKNLLNVWKRLLQVNLSKKLVSKVCGSDSSEKSKLANHLSEIKVSISWILINLTWKDQDFGYGFQMPDKTNFRLLDTISSASNASSNNTFSSVSNIVIEESDEDEDMGDSNSDEMITWESEFTPEARARVLYKSGFCKVLEKIIQQISSPASKSGGVVKPAALERFDNLNTNELYEKSKTAHFQIISLMSKMKQDSNNSQQQTAHTEVRESLPLRRSSNIVSSRESHRIRRDVNRGGEGYGYESDDNEARTDADAISRSPQAPDGANQEPQPENQSEEFDDYWVQ